MVETLWQDILLHYPEVSLDGFVVMPNHLHGMNYYEHVIRGEAALLRIRRYIAENPARWAEDPENPGRGGGEACLAPTERSVTQ